MALQNTTLMFHSTLMMNKAQILYVSTQGPFILRSLFLHSILTTYDIYLLYSSLNAPYSLMPLGLCPSCLFFLEHPLHCEAGSHTPKKTPIFRAMFKELINRFKLGMRLSCLMV